MFQKFGIVPQDGPSRDHDADDPGRFAITGRARDQRVFRVPSLRNVGVTAPYDHDGRIETLADAVDLMARRQLGKVLAAEEIDLIVRFLHTLTGTYQGKVYGGGWQSGFGDHNHSYSRRHTKNWNNQPIIGPAQQSYKAPSRSMKRRMHHPKRSFRKQMRRRGFRF